MLIYTHQFTDVAYFVHYYAHCVCVCVHVCVYVCVYGSVCVCMCMRAHVCMCNLLLYIISGSVWSSSGIITSPLHPCTDGPLKPVNGEPSLKGSDTLAQTVPG